MVWQDDKPLKRNDNNMPTLELRSRERRVRKAISSIGEQCVPEIPCSKSFGRIDELIKVYVGASCITRLQAKALIRKNASANTGWLGGNILSGIGQNFGFKGPIWFLRLATTLPIQLIRKNSDSLLKAKPLLLAWLDFFEAAKGDAYYQSLKKNQFLEHKFKSSNKQIE